MKFFFFFLFASATAALAQVNIPAYSIGDFASPEKFGAVGDGVVDDTAAVNSALAASREVYLSLGKTYLVSALSNPLGSLFTGSGKIVKTVAGGQRMISSGLDRGQYVTGREYMSYAHKKMIASLGSGSGLSLVFSGDSTTNGDSSTAPFRIWELVPAAANRMGFRGVIGTNRGQSGKNTSEWVSTYLSGDLALTPDVLVLRWGFNDGSTLASVAASITSLRSGLATIRASRGVAALSIVLCTPNSGNDTANGRDEKFFEQHRLGVLQAARDYQCVFVDVYGYLRDSVSAADWMDDPYADGRHVHPLNVMNVWIAGLITDAIFPSGLSAEIGQNKNVNISGSFETRTPQSAIGTYPKGLSQYRATGGSPAWPYDGTVVTHYFADDSAMQTNYAYIAGDDRYAYRFYRSGAWGAFFYAGFTSGGNVTPASGFALPGSGDNMSVGLSGSTVLGVGYIQKSSPSTIAAGTALATMPGGYRPSSFGTWGLQLAVWDNTNWVFPHARLGPDGILYLQEAVAINATRIYFGPSVWSTL